MLHELTCNAHKGDWLDCDLDSSVAELFYHAFKLALAAYQGKPEAILEYAADTGNHALFIADQAGALDTDKLTPGHVESDDETALDNPDYGRWRSQANELVKLLREAAEKGMQTRQLPDPVEELC